MMTFRENLIRTVAYLALAFVTFAAVAAFVLLINQ